MSLIVSRNNLLILPGGSLFAVAGTSPDPMPKLATNTLARARQTQAVNVHDGAGLVSSPAGFYVILAEKALDEAGVAYEAGTTLYMPPESPVQVAAKSGVSKVGDIEVIHGRPHPRSAKAMACGIAATSAAFIVGYAMFG